MSEEKSAGSKIAGVLKSIGVWTDVPEKEFQRIAESVPEVDTLDEDQRDLFDRVALTPGNFFVQGQAGTGKSTFVGYLKKNLEKRMIVVCPTAVAAINIGGSTIHSLFRIPPKDFLILNQLSIAKKTREVLKRTDLLVIDEISMVRPDILDAIDYIAKVARMDNRPFGGLQLLLIGDLCQLPPVIPNSAREVFFKEYGSKDAYFFDAKSYKAANFKYVELSKVYRQSDLQLLQYLVDVRECRNLPQAVEFFNKAKIPDVSELEYAVTITPKRAVAEQINQRRLDALKAPVKNYACELKDKFEEKDAPAPCHLGLKEGALVMFNKNNQPQWFNGTGGVVESLENDVIRVRLLNGARELVSVKRESWKKFDYEIEGDKVVEREVGEFIQFPLQLGYALTIHKAQGKTLDKVVVDLDTGGAFAHGQMYVALSRTRKFGDMHLKYDMCESDVILDERVVRFLDENRRAA